MIETFRTIIPTILCCFVAPLVLCASEPQSNGAARKDGSGFLDEFLVLKKECDDQLSSLYKKLHEHAEAATNSDERERLAKSIQGESEIFIAPTVKKAFELVKPHAAEGVAIEPLFWVAKRGGSTETGHSAASLLIEHHLTNQKTIEMAFGMRGSEVTWVERMLRAQLESPDLPEPQRPRQMLALAQTLQSLVEKGEDRGGELEQEATRLFTELGEKYAERNYKGGVTFGDLAKSSLFEIERLSVGKVAPDIIGEDMDGVPLKLSDFRGKVVMVSFWASWCGPCVAQLPHDCKLVKQYEGRPFVLIGVNSDPIKEAVTPLTGKKMIAWRSFWCGVNGPLGPIPRTWNVNHWPTNYLIDHKGIIRAKSLQDSMIEKLVVEAEEATGQASAVGNSRP